MIGQTVDMIPKYTSLVVFSLSSRTGLAITRLLLTIEVLGPYLITSIHGNNDIIIQTLSESF